MTRTPSLPDTDAERQPAVHDRRALLGKLAVGGAGAAIGAGLLSTGVRAAGGRFQQVDPPAAGTVFFPISPERAYDSRQPNYTERGPLAPNTDRVISVANGHSADGTQTTADVVPEGATAVLINVTAAAMTAGNYLSVTAGDVTTTVTSVVNWPDDATQVANAISIPVDADRAIRVYCGDQAGSTDVIIDVFGYYAPVLVEEPPTTSTTTTTVVE
jgi:hypothetical protein